MNTSKHIKTAKMGYIIISVILCLLGIMLIVNPRFSVSLLCRLGGVVLIAFGIVKIVGYCSRDLYRLAFQYDLAFGILLIALGVLLLFFPQRMTNTICILLGIYILADALLKIQISIDSKSFGIRRWWLILTMAVITGIAGFLLIFRPSAGAEVIMIILGVSLVTEGVLNIVTILAAVNVTKGVF